MEYLSYTLPANALSFSPARKLRIGVIGVGAAGLAAIKVLKDSEQFKTDSLEITAFEAREDVGGIWLPALPVDNPPLTPLYDSLTTNLPHPLMAFSSLLFPPSTNLYPGHEVVEAYLKSYATEFGLMQHIKLSSRVQKAFWKDGIWCLEVEGTLYEFDQLIVANGHFRKPYYPDIPGLQKWVTSGKAMHSAWYRHPQFMGKRILVVGGGPSGSDIMNEMRMHCTTLIHSVGQLPPGAGEPPANVVRHGRAVRFVESGTVHFADGASESDIDYCILATGYNTDIPFLQDVKLSIPNPVPPLPHHLHNSGFHIFPLAKGLFPLQVDFPPSSIAFMGLPVRVVPFPLFEAQARAALKAFVDSEALDLRQGAIEIIERYEIRREQAKGNESLLAKEWHKLQGNEQFTYRDMLHGFAGFTGEQWKVKRWEIDIFSNNKVTLLREWEAIERAGEADRWVEGVGYDGIDEWVELMYKILKRGGVEVPDKSAKL